MNPVSNSSNIEGQQIQVICTRRGCHALNTVPEADLIGRPANEIRCAHCQMPLILQKHFVAQEIIGEGGFGITFRGMDLDEGFSDRTRVIKLLKLPDTQPPEIQNRIKEMFQQECRILNKLIHKNIPRFFASFAMEVDERTGYVKGFFYLVQGYIEGQNLAQELQEREQRGEKFSEDEVINILKEIMEILRYIHNYDGDKGAIHRDIKPANIMRSRDGNLYLIDFGAVKQIAQGLPVETTSIVLDPCFAPYEQFCNKPLSPAADLYSAATTCICLLTGNTNPNQLLEESDIKDILRAQQVRNQRFATALTLMLEHKPKDRPQSAQEVLDILDGKKQPWAVNFLNWLQNNLNYLIRLAKIRWWIKWGILVLLGVAIAVIIWPTVIKWVISPPPVHHTNYFSRGEEALFPENTGAIYTNIECKNAYDKKQEGIQAFAKQDYLKAENDFRQANQQFKQAAATTDCKIDPETVIYEYNAKVAQNPSNRSLPTIAVVIPGEPQRRSIALEILRGVAQSLDANTPLFQILIASEDNQRNQIDTKTIAEYISKSKIPGDENFGETKILGVIGHSPSPNTWKAGKIYGAAQLSDTEKIVLISPTSTAIRTPDLIQSTEDLNTYVFRTSSNDAIAARDLAEEMWNSEVKKAVMIYNPRSNYSISLKINFRNYLETVRQVDANRYIIKYCELHIDTPDTCIAKAKNAKAEALILFPDTSSLNKALAIIPLANKQFKLFAGDVMYDQATLNFKESAKGMIFAVFSHVDKMNSYFRQQAEDIGWEKDITWRSMSAYDAAQVFITALRGNSNPTRLNIYEKLKSDNFYAPGSTNAKVEFDNDGDRKTVTDVGVLVEINKNSNNSDEYDFKFLKTPQRK